MKEIKFNGEHLAHACPAQAGNDMIQPIVYMIKTYTFPGTKMLLYAPFCSRD